MVGFPNWPMGFPTKNDQHLGCEIGKPTILGNRLHIYSKTLRIQVSLPDRLGFFESSNPHPEKNDILGLRNPEISGHTNGFVQGMIFVHYYTTICGDLSSNYQTSSSREHLMRQWDPLQVLKKQLSNIHNASILCICCKYKYIYSKTNLYIIVIYIYNIFFCITHGWPFKPSPNSTWCQRAVAETSFGPPLWRWCAQKSRELRSNWEGWESEGEGGCFELIKEKKGNYIYVHYIYIYYVCKFTSKHVHIYIIYHIEYWWPMNKNMLLLSLSLLYA